MPDSCASLQTPSAAAAACCLLLLLLQISAAVADVLKTKLKIDPARFYLKVRHLKWQNHTSAGMLLHPASCLPVVASAHSVKRPGIDLMNQS
jgi:hypothetical protein